VVAVEAEIARKGGHVTLSMPENAGGDSDVEHRNTDGM